MELDDDPVLSLDAAEKMACRLQVRRGIRGDSAGTVACRGDVDGPVDDGDIEC
jgi:hypothetical protein